MVKETPDSRVLIEPNFFWYIFSFDTKHSKIRYKIKARSFT